MNEKLKQLITCRYRYLLENLLNLADIYVGQSRIIIDDGDYHFDDSEVLSEDDDMSGGEQSDSEVEEQVQVSLNADAVVASTNESNLDKSSESSAVESDNDSNASDYDGYREVDESQSSSDTVSDQNESSDAADENSGSEEESDTEPASKRPKFRQELYFSKYMVGYSSKYDANRFRWSLDEEPELPRSGKDFLDLEAICINDVDEQNEDEDAEGGSTSADLEKMEEKEVAIRTLFHELVPFLPINPLDELLDRLHGIDLIELTSRKHTYERDPEDELRWVKKRKRVSPISKQKARQAFMDGKCRVAVISDAASVGISLHSDVKCANQQPRTMIIVELPWAADKIAQQMGKGQTTVAFSHVKHFANEKP